MIRRIHILSIVLVLAASTAAAQTPAAAGSSAPSLDATGAFFGLSVSDLDASVRWYSEKLGLRVVMRAPARDGISVVVLEGSGLLVELLHHAGADRETAARPQSDFRVPGAFKVGVIVRDFDAALAFLRGREVPFAMGPFPERADQPPNVLIRDNEGNLIQVLGRRRAP